MTSRIAFNPQDRFVVTMGSTLIVTTQNGDVFGHEFAGHGSGDAFQFSGAKAAFNPQDRFVVTMGDMLIVTTQNGDVFGHEISGHHIGDAFQFSGAKAAFNPQDRFVVTMGSMLIVTTQNGDVFGHEISGHHIGDAFQFSGAKAAFNPQDRFVVTIGNMLIVTTQNGGVFGHEISGHHIGDAFQFSGARAAFNPQDRFVVTMGSMLIVTTQFGDAFGHEISGHHIGDAFHFNPTDPPLTLSLSSFQCLDQSDEIRVLFGFNTEDDEPYAIVFAVDLMMDPVVPVPTGAVNSKATLVGPLADVDVDDVTSAPGNVIWGLSDAPSTVSSADNLIVLVAMMENDSSSASQVRSVLERAAQAALLSNLSAFVGKLITRQELVNRIIADMNGAMGLAKVGAPDPDDHIGAILELRFLQSELDGIRVNPVPIEKSLTFEGDDAKYVLNFTMHR